MVKSGEQEPEKIIDAFGNEQEKVDWLDDDTWLADNLGPDFATKNTVQKTDEKPGFLKSAEDKIAERPVFERDHEEEARIEAEYAERQEEKIRAYREIGHAVEQTLAIESSIGEVSKDITEVAKSEDSEPEQMTRAELQAMLNEETENLTMTSSWDKVTDKDLFTDVDRYAKMRGITIKN